LQIKRIACGGLRGELTVSGIVCNCGRSVMYLNSRLQDEFEALGQHVPSFGHPVFALLYQNHRGEPERRRRRGEYPYRSRLKCNYVAVAHG
jgi:hypothetical protein